MGERSRSWSDALLAGRYEPLFPLASGGMAQVHVARAVGEAGFARLVALKLMHPHLSEDPSMVRMFLDEARLAADIRSVHVVPTLDLGRTREDQLFIVMDLVYGTSLSQIARRVLGRGERVPVAVAAEIVAQAAEGLHAAHTATDVSGRALHIVHRDVSPQNILVGRDGIVRITDFGIATAVRRVSQTTQIGRLKGKLSYLAPEQIGGSGSDARTDQYALGVVAWELLAGRKLHGREGGLLERAENDTIPPLRTVRGDVPPQVEQVVARALERRPRHRYGTVAAFGSALRRAVDATGALASPEDVRALVHASASDIIDGLVDRVRACSGLDEHGGRDTDVGTVVPTAARAGGPLEPGAATLVSPSPGPDPAGQARGAAGALGRTGGPRVSERVVPGERSHTLTDVSGVVRTLRWEDDGPARPPAGPDAIAAAETAPLLPAPSTGAERWEPSGRKRRPAAVALAALSVVAIGLGYALGWDPAGSSPPASKDGAAAAPEGTAGPPTARSDEPPEPSDDDPGAPGGRAPDAPEAPAPEPAAGSPRPERPGRVATDGDAPRHAVDPLRARRHRRTARARGRPSPSAPQRGGVSDEAGGTREPQARERTLLLPLEAFDAEGGSR